MKIKKAEIFIVDLPLIHPFTISFGTIDKRSTVIVKLTSDEGIVGWGEAAALPAPIFSYETVDTAVLMLEKYLIPAIIEKAFNTPTEFITAYATVKGHPFAKCGLECAFWCLLAKKKNKSLSALFGGTQTKIPVGESIGIHATIESTLEEIRIRLKEGYRRIKIKIKPEWDISLVEAVRKAFGDIPFMVDANSAYTLNDVALLKKMDEYHLIMIEQPLGDSDIIDHATLQKQMKTPVCLDESILSLDDARKAIELGACKIVNIKPGRVGGIVESIKIHDYCQKQGIPVWCGGMLESGIGRAFNIALASLPNFTLPADMSPTPVFYKEDIINPTYTVSPDGCIDVSREVGLGYAVDEEKIGHYASARKTVQ